jgi:PIN domain nuclease of toxin-antitoxin system
MRLLLDTHLLLWAVVNPSRLSLLAQTLIGDSQNEILFSTVSIWETAIKHSRGKPQFQVEPGKFRNTLLNSDYIELPIFGEHAVAVAGLPHIHKDPFDRLLIAQSMVEGITLLTGDAWIARYPGAIQPV